MLWTKDLTGAAACLSLFVVATIFPSEGSNLNIAAQKRNKKGDIFNMPFSNSKFRLKNNSKKKIAMTSNKYLGYSVITPDL